MYDNMHSEIQTNFGMISEYVCGQAIQLFKSQTNLKACTVTYIYIHYIQYVYVSHCNYSVSM